MLLPATGGASLDIDRSILDSGARYFRTKE